METTRQEKFISARRASFLLGILATLAPLGVGTARAADAGPGDLYVQSSPAGAGVLVDGLDTGLTTPALLRGLSAGQHELRVEQGCNLAVAQVEVRPQLVTRTELTLQPGSGRVELGSTPAGAEVTLDGVLRGQTPLELAAACGSHELRLSLEGYHPWSAPLALASDELIERSVELVAIARGTLVIVPEPLDAQVWLDGAQVGQGAMTLEDIEAGVHELELRARGLSAQHRRVEVPDGEVLRVEVSLSRPPPMAALPADLPAEPAQPSVDRHILGRRVLASAVALAGAGLATHGGITWGRTAPVYQDYLAMQDHRAADLFYDENVAPARIVIGVDLVAAGALLASATGLWIHAPHDKAPRDEGRTP